MNINIDIVKLKSHIGLLYEEKCLAEQLRELSCNCYFEDIVTLDCHETIFKEQQHFFEIQLKNVEQRIILLEKIIEKVELYVASTEEQLKESARHLKLVIEDMDL